MRRSLFTERVLRLEGGCTPFIICGLTPLHIVVEDRQDIQVSVKGFGLSGLPIDTRRQGSRGRVFIDCALADWTLGQFVWAVTVRIPRDVLIEARTRGRITTAGHLGDADLSGRSVVVEEVAPHLARASWDPATRGRWAPSVRLNARSVTVRKVSGSLKAMTFGGPAWIWADDPGELVVGSFGGDIHVQGHCDIQVLDAWGPLGRVFILRDT